MSENAVARPRNDTSRPRAASTGESAWPGSQPARIKSDERRECRSVEIKTAKGRPLYTARCERSGRWWAVHVPEINGVRTQARRLDQVEAMARDAIAGALDVPPDSFDIGFEINWRAQCGSWWTRVYPIGGDYRYWARGWGVVTVKWFPYPVGTYPSGQLTHFVTYVWRNGYLWTMHPGLPW